jgi:hypothetical protein
MNSSYFSLAFVLAATVSTQLLAADLSKIDRRIAKEPVYKSKSVKYCLLAFGQEPKTRVWLVHDFDTLYADRNGNGDLTEEGERVKAKPESSDPDEGAFHFEAGDVLDRKLLHKNLRLNVRKLDHASSIVGELRDLLAKNPQARGYGIDVDVEMPGWNGGGLGGRVQQHVTLLDSQGVLQFGTKPHDAPVIHFGGPWQITLFGRGGLTVGREEDLILGFGTPGIGPGTTAYVAYEGIVPEEAHPEIEISYPLRRLGEAPVRKTYELKERC